LLRRLLFSLARQTVAPRAEIIVVDSHGGDGTSEMVARFSRRVLPVSYLNVANALATKRNAGAVHARAHALVFLDDDMRLDDVACLEDVLGELDRTSVPVCLRVSYPEKWHRQSTYYRFKQRAHEVTNARVGEIAAWRFVAMAFAIRADHYRAVGGFDEDFREYGCEDHAFEFSLRSHGLAPVLSQSARALHCEPSATFARYREKLVNTAQLTMPLLLQRWPAALSHRGVSFLEGPLVGRGLRLLTPTLVGRIAGGLAALLDRLPVGCPDAVFRPLTRLYVAAAYVEGRARRRGG